MVKFGKIFCLGACIAMLSACSSDKDPVKGPENGGYELGDMQIERLKYLQLMPTFEAGANATFQWTLIQTPSGKVETPLGSTKQIEFIAIEEGIYLLQLKITNEGKTLVLDQKVTVTKEAKAYDPYLTKVYDYLPGVGQFVNKLPTCNAGDTHETMRGKAEALVKGAKPGIIHLGGFGGYVVFGFDHPVVNVTGKRDIRLLGNAFWSNSNPSPNQRGGSCEPGIVMVMQDTNKNGIPDDEWYEIAGSEYAKAETIKNYEITYYKPAVEPTSPTKEYIRWEDNQGNSGYKEKNVYHNQSYFPQWIQEDKITFKGTKLVDNGVDMSGVGTNWVLFAYGFGYVDNVPNDDNDSAIDISWAVDKAGKPVSLQAIDFIKVYSGVNQECGWLGENSTEFGGAQDLHLLSISIDSNINE